ncbi:alpha-galactosidase [Erythrobacter sp. YT30]|nr:alpha-galactosidase [Erythrobacter sp. YT30]
MSGPFEDSESKPHHLELRAGGALLAIEASAGMRPVLIYAGPDISGITGEELALLATRQHAPGTPSIPLRGSLLNEIGTGISGPSGITGHREGQDWALDLRVVSTKMVNGKSIHVRCEDKKARIGTNHVFEIDASTGMLRSSTSVDNIGDAPFQIDWCAALCLPFDQRLERFLSFTGRWAQEFQIEEVALFNGSIVRENKSGRTSHDVFPGGILACRDTTEQSGLALGFHLAWSGNHKLRVDRHSDGRGFLQLGELLFPGELRLEAGERYQTPQLLSVWSQNGTNGIAQAFHRFFNDTVADPRTRNKPRPVHFNTWEAVYFDHDEDTLIELAKSAASVGAERFVLDDGWFGGRRNDATGLGDWWVSEDVFPNGLHQLVKTVRELGMEFGLWFEPEMVNPDSDLYRTHPDWVLGADSVEIVPFRGQLTLDLTKKEVVTYLFEKISKLVNEYGIDYIKWDMNRDTHHPGSEGKGAMHRQTMAVYGLLDRLREKHPALEIESCSSGGGRADYRILERTDRIWTSDNNDARERQIIQRGAAHFFPLRILGSHVGPRRCHITGRELPMAFRVGSAVFGSMGMELDLRDESEEDLAILKAGIALYKKHRHLIHEGSYLALPSAKGTNLVGCVARDKQEAFFSYAKLETDLATLPQRIHFAGLDPAKDYQLRMIWPETNPSISSPSIVDQADLQGKGVRISGAALVDFGVQPPLTFPDTCLFYHLRAFE